ncbi:MAG: hypothetical protein CM15mP83_2760 [Flavobacteriaceae bacterium]|nr:MAG: hypothetical protein CM15mP83_2760 [Flavobacteriaceae bacterium]
MALHFIYNAFMAVSSLTFLSLYINFLTAMPKLREFGCPFLWMPWCFGNYFYVIPVVAWLSKNGEEKAFMLTQSISILGYILLILFIHSGKPWMYIIALPFFSFGIGSLFTIMMSMTADVIDVDELNSGKRREGVFGGDLLVDG